MSRTQLWVEKYRPTSIDDLASQEEVTKTLRGAIAQGQLPHLLMYGPPGTGKTSTILAVARTLYHPSVLKDRVLEMNASDERGIKIVRDKIKNFASQTASDATSRRPHAIDATRLHQRRRWVVFFSILRLFRETRHHSQVALRQQPKVRRLPEPALQDHHPRRVRLDDQRRPRRTQKDDGGLLVHHALLPDLQLRQSHHRAVSFKVC